MLAELRVGEKLDLAKEDSSDYLDGAICVSAPTVHLKADDVITTFRIAGEVVAFALEAERAELWANALRENFVEQLSGYERNRR